MSNPLVSVVCLCYNQQQFVEEAVQSILQQTYLNIELILVDDASTDNSIELIKQIAQRNSLTNVLLLNKNIGNCAAFNRGLALATGDFIVDFAADDVMMPDRIAKQVALFQILPQNYGVVFTDAEYIDENGTFIRNHYEYLFEQGLLKEVPHGDVYTEVVSRYFISSPSMLVRREVMELLHGYDEQLAYEDFDFWIRSAREFRYAFLNERLTKVRKTKKSMSTGWYKKGDKQLHSTYLVCKKAQQLSRSKLDDEALLKRVRYELKQSFFSENFIEAKLFYALLKELSPPSIFDQFIFKLTKMKIPSGFVRSIYYKTRFNQS